MTEVKFYDTVEDSLLRFAVIITVADGKLVFDYQSGDLRQCRLYSLQELIALGEKYLEK